MFNEKLTGFAREHHTNPEIIAAMKELKEIYESLKHFPGKHNQEDHAWNAGISTDSKKKRRSSPRSSSLSSFRRSNFASRYTRKNNQTQGISSAFEASAAASAQSRALGVVNPLALMKAVTVAAGLLQSWSNKFKNALLEPSDKLAKQLAKEFEKLSKTITELGQKLGEDTVAQNVYKSIIKSYQETLITNIPQTKDIFEKYSLYDENTPDKKMADKVEQTIAETKKEAE